MTRPFVFQEPPLAHLRGQALEVKQVTLVQSLAQQLHLEALTQRLQLLQKSELPLKSEQQLKLPLQDSTVMPLAVEYKQVPLGQALELHPHLEVSMQKQQLLKNMLEPLKQEFYQVLLWYQAELLVSQKVPAQVPPRKHLKQLLVLEFLPLALLQSQIESQQAPEYPTQPGDIWTANCHKCTCTDAETVDCKLKECPSPPTCKPEERLVKFKDNDTCCEIGYCEPRTCLFNNNDYEVGASFADPNNPCISYSCHNTGFVAVVQDCPKQTWCAEEDRVYDSTKCCYTCKPNCRSSSVNVTVNYNGCKKKVEMARCTGECKKTIKYDYDIFQLKNSCLCCQEENYEYREIDLDCPDGGTIPYRF
ncbi:hypothetical protein MJG53_004501 [Ovis ammon polii x Ovis aries]|uniref:Uncharacterized protein n=1 Tax=Ovis ammon polii x Ovis aries TaxID=2918886 RepID=A0ACB9V9S3_9CETA|nr:hypothetical protein MJG53_004501 [Ovis ammon polii x Ovis aries]